MCLRRLKDRELVACLPVFRHTSAGTFVRGEVNVLTAKGAQLVREHYAAVGYDPEALRWSPKIREYTNQTIDHELAINDVAIAAVTAARSAGIALHDWHDDQQLHSLKASGRVRFFDFTPDGFFILETPQKRQPYFIEVDRGTESVTGRAPNTWQRKIERYGTYLKERYRDDPYFAGLPAPLVLTVTTGPERLGNLLDATRTAGGQKAYWFTTRAWIEPPYDFLGAIWQVPTIDGFLSLADQLSR